jgi:hypothetical protein
LIAFAVINASFDKCGVERLHRMNKAGGLTLHAPGRRDCPASAGGGGIQTAVSAIPKLHG